MSPVRSPSASGVITFHTPFSVSPLRPEELTADVTDGGCGGAGRRRRDEASSPGPQPGAQRGAQRGWLSRASLSQLQAKMEAENQEARGIIKPLLDTENGFVKGLERFLSQREVTELRRRELLHKRWTERVWFPLQRRVEEHVSSCSPAEARRRQGLYNHYLHHCNAKGFVFLETYDLKEYNPFLLNIKKPHRFKLSTADLKDSLHLELHERLGEKRTARSCEAGCKYTRRQAEKLPPSEPPLCESATPQASVSLRASSNYPVSASRKTPAVDEIEGKKSSRLDTIPYHIGATASPDGLCRRSGCMFSTSASNQRVYSSFSP